MSSQIRRALRPVAIGAERVVWGAEHRRRLFEALLSGHYGSRRRRVWRYVEREDAPHFFDQRHNALALVTGDGNVEGFLRAFYALDVTRAGDEVLDIGCGDGFFARHFLARRAAHVDAVDIEPSAIAHARRVHPHPRVHHQLLDAVTEPFPRAAYDVIVFDGALGHFPAATTDGVLAKIAQALKPGGVFVGSETLGRREGHDHLQFFESLDELGTTLKAHFAHVALREAQYEIEGGLERREAFWRCAIDEPGARRSAWRSFEQ